MSLLYCLPLVLKILQRSGSCCCCYIVEYYCFRFDKGVVHIVVILSNITVLGLDKGVVHVVVILSTITL